MTRSLRALVALLLVSFALSAAACADATAPQPRGTCDYTSGNICH
jgi:hypothetical protein